MKRAAFLILILLVTWCPALGAKTIDLDSATIADINAAFKAGTLTAESLVQLCLARIRSYDREGPSLHAVMILNPKAIETARELDAERKAKGPRSALHGIPVVLKDNYNTADLPTTGGSVLLEGSIPPADAFVVKKLRDAGAIILGKDEHVRVCLTAFAELARRAVVESPRSHAITGRFLRWHRRRHCGGVCAARHGDRYRRFDPRAIDGERHCGFETDAWSAQQKRNHPAFADI